ncbi:CHAT domain-containing protein [Desulfatirhabdium butyrativorans]|uniref:CHAT domain-containing protein n=1 Tax=Desulfatirhabdium butyrativorans TaxID=340467 RepID=UPI0004166920|nr:CHAT domain-containing protein [Desulfatirhabdium butyrativorans]
MFKISVCFSKTIFACKHICFYFYASPLLVLLIFFSPVLTFGTDTAAILARYPSERYQAIEELMQQAETANKLQQFEKQTQILLEVVRIYQSYARYMEAESVLEKALHLARVTNNERMAAWGTTYMGMQKLITGNAREAAPYLETSLSKAKELDDRQLLAACCNHLGLYWMTQQHVQNALSYFERSIQASSDPVLTAMALTNAAKASMGFLPAEVAMGFAGKAAQTYRNLADSEEKVIGLLANGEIYLSLWKEQKIDREACLSSAYPLFQDALQTAKQLNSHHLLAMAYGSLGLLYEKAGKLDEALQLSRLALWSAQQSEEFSLYRWLWQIGRIHSLQGNTDAAISAYRQAAERLEAVRLDILNRSLASQKTFRDRVGSLFLELANLLIRKADAASAGPSKQALLLEARDRMEQLKIAELQDYFQDQCVVAYSSTKARLDTISLNTAILYPIMLPDHTEILVSIGNDIHHFAVPVDYTTLANEIQLFRSRLEKRITREYMRPAQRLYDWLVRPTKELLDRNQIRTIVVVPDGPLRSIPFAAMHDGSEFLVQRYAIGVTPGLYLTDPKPIDHLDIKVLVMGLSEATQGFPALPYVTQEVDQITSLIPGVAILNQHFLVPDIQQRLSEDNFSIVHIASHSLFTGDKDHSYILTYDDRLNIQQLDQCLGIFRFRQKPLEVLTLSACETAVGDDRAALGLAGIAIKAGARSALASLWSIHDQTTSMLVTRFYKELLKPGVSRTQALQTAQMMLMKDERYAHPIYWAPFLLIANWL